MFNQIVNPVTNKPVKLNSKIGKKILENYTKISGQTGGKWYFNQDGDPQNDISILVNDPDEQNANNPVVTGGLKNILKFIQNYGFAVICNSRGIKPDNVFKVYSRGRPNISGHIIDLHCTSLNTKGLFMKLIVAPPTYSFGSDRIDASGLIDFEDFQLKEIGNDIRNGLSALHDKRILSDGQIDTSIENNRNLTSIKGFIVSDPRSHRWAEGQTIGGAIARTINEPLGQYLRGRSNVARWGNLPSGAIPFGEQWDPPRTRLPAEDTPTGTFINNYINNSNNRLGVPRQRFAMIFMERLNVTWKSAPVTDQTTHLHHPTISSAHPGIFEHNTGYSARNINLKKYFSGLEGNVDENYVNDQTPENKPVLVGLKRKLSFIKDIASGIKRLHDEDLCFNDLKLDNVGAILEADFGTNSNNSCANGFAFTPTARDIRGDFINQPNITLTGKIVDYGGVTTSNYSLTTNRKPIHTPSYADWKSSVADQPANPGLPNWERVDKSKQLKADIYALGIIAFNMFPADSDETVHELIMSGLIGSPGQGNVEGTMLDKERRTRPTIEEVIYKIDTLIHNIQAQPLIYIIRHQVDFTNRRYSISSTQSASTQPTPPPRPPPRPPPTQSTQPTVSPPVPAAQENNLQIQCDGFIGIIENITLNDYELQEEQQQRIANEIHAAGRDVDSHEATLPPVRPHRQSGFYHCIIDEAYAIVLNEPELLSVERRNFGARFLNMGMKKEGYDKLVFLLVQFLQYNHNAAFDVLTRAYRLPRETIIQSNTQGHVPPDIQVAVLECAKFPREFIEYEDNFSGDNDDLKDNRRNFYVDVIQIQDDISIKTILDFFIQTHYGQVQIPEPVGSQSVSLPDNYTQVADHETSCLDKAINDRENIIGYRDEASSPYLYKIKRLHGDVRQEIRCFHNPNKLIREQGATYSQLVWVYDPSDGNLRGEDGVTRDLKFIHNDCVTQKGIFYKEDMVLDNRRYIPGTISFSHICSGADEFDDGSIYQVLNNRDFGGAGRIPYARTLVELKQRMDSS